MQRHLGRPTDGTIDEATDESFPASDPPAWTPLHIGEPASGASPLPASSSPTRAPDSSDRPPSYAIAQRVTLTPEEAARRTRDELKREGFGVLTEIDVRATLKEKLAVDMPPYVILGACHPTLAHAAISSEPDIGLLLPCNVVIRVDPMTQVTVVEALDPVAQLGLADNPELWAFAAEARSRLQRVVHHVASEG